MSWKNQSSRSYTGKHDFVSTNSFYSTNLDIVDITAINITATNITAENILGTISGEYISLSGRGLNIGYEAGKIPPLPINNFKNSIAIGNQAGYENQNQYAIAIGNQAGYNAQNEYAIAIGNKAGETSQHANSIILNASAIELNSTNSGLFIEPIRNDNTILNTSLNYNTTTREITYTTENILPTGSIIMWYGNISNIPLGFALCDGSGGTPDLRDRFIVGAGNDYSMNDTGGSADAVVVDHSHNINIIDPGHSHLYTQTTFPALPGVGLVTPNSNTVIYSTPATSVELTNITATADPSGVSGTNKNLPPYYALAFIMKI